MQLLRCREGNLIFRAKESEGALPDLEVLEGKRRIVTAQVEVPKVSSLRNVSTQE